MKDKQNLHKARTEIKNGTCKMPSEDEYEREMEVFFCKDGKVTPQLLCKNI